MHPCNIVTTHALSCALFKGGAIKGGAARRGTALPATGGVLATRWSPGTFFPRAVIHRYLE